MHGFRPQIVYVRYKRNPLFLRIFCRCQRYIIWRNLTVNQIIVPFLFQQLCQILCCNPVTVDSSQINIFLISRLIDKFQIKFIILFFYFIKLSLGFFPMLKSSCNQIHLISCIRQKISDISKTAVTFFIIQFYAHRNYRYLFHSHLLSILLLPVPYLS